MASGELDPDALRRSIEGYLATFETTEEREAAMLDFMAEIIERVAVQQGPEAADQFMRTARLMLEKMLLQRGDADGE